jgi:hypothetical protein
MVCIIVLTENKTGAMMTKKATDDTFNFQLLGRLQQDCDYYLGHGNRSKKNLWANDEAEQIAKMREIYNGLSEKPEWITLADIAKYEAEMIGAHNGKN